MIINRNVYNHPVMHFRDAGNRSGPEEDLYSHTLQNAVTEPL